MKLPFRAFVLIALASLSPLGHAAEPIRLLTDFSLSPDGETLLFSWAGDVWRSSASGGPATRLTSHPGNDREPAFSPDGAEISFTSRRDGAYQIFRMPAGGGAPEQVTHHSEGYSLVGYHPDGDRVLARGNRDHFWRDATRLFLVNLRERAADALLFDAHGETPSLSRDGRKVLFCREGVNVFRKGYRGSQASQIWSYDTGEETFTEVRRDEHGYRWPMWRPDGDGFYYVGQQDGAFNLYLYEQAADRTRQLTDYADDGVLFPCISRDGSTIVFRHRFDLYRLDPRGDGRPVRIDIVNPGDPVGDPTLRRSIDRADACTFTDDGLECAFIAGGDLWVMDTELREPRQVTDSAAFETDPVFDGAGEAILFASCRDGQCDIWRAERKDAERYWWQNEEFVLTRLTEDAATETGLRLSPDGEHIAFIRGRGDLMVMDTHGKNVRRVLSSWSAPSFDWSPDGKWITYSADDENFNSDVFVTPVDGSREPFNISMHPDNDMSPKWSPDGRVIAFTGRRADRETDVHYVWLREEDELTGARDRTLKKALEKMTKQRGGKKKGSADKPKDAPGDASSDDKEADDEKAKDKDKEKEKEKTEDGKGKGSLPEVVIDFESIHDRLHTISTNDTSDRGLFWIEDKKLAFSSTIGGRGGLYTVTFPDELSPKYLASSGIADPVSLGKAKKIAGIASNRPSLLATNGQVTNFAFRVLQAVDRGERYLAAFEEAWRQMRDDFYDGSLNHRNWDEIRRKYSDAARAAIDGTALDQVVDMMLGELNGSHLGYSSTERRGGPSQDDEWSDTTAHLGLRFDPAHRGPGWKVSSVIPEGPTHAGDGHVVAGEVILSVDGVTVDPALDPTVVLNGPLDRDIRLLVRATDGAERTVDIRPTSFGRARAQLYDAWLERNRASVDEQSGGRLGYLHVRGMNWSSFLQFEEDLYRIGYGKDGLVIDVRANGGGSTTDHLLTSLTQPRHAMTLPRGGATPGYPQDRMVYATWSKPIVVLCDQNSFSNAEIFSHAIKTLGRGPLVGVTTAGGVISTGGGRVMDLGFLRKPFRGWFLIGDGADMEKNGAVPDYVVWPQPGELPGGVDRQLDKAIEVLTRDVTAWKARGAARPRYASER